jgi:hypothetical protein
MRSNWKKKCEFFGMLSFLGFEAVFRAVWGRSFRFCGIKFQNGGNVRDLKLTTFQ